MRVRLDPACNFGPEANHSNIRCHQKSSELSPSPNQDGKRDESSCMRLVSSSEFSTLCGGWRTFPAIAAKRFLKIIHRNVNAGPSFGRVR